MFFSTTQVLVNRANKSKEPEDIKHTIIYLRYLRRQSIGAFNVLPINIPVMLVDALSIRAELELGDVMQDIEEMAVLCLEILNSHVPSPLGSIMALVQAVKAQFRNWSEQKEPSAKVIDCLREANIRFSDSDEISITLAWSFFNRFHITYSNDDYEEGTAILDKIIASRAPGDRLNQYQEMALKLIAPFAQARSTAYGKPEYLEDAIHRLRILLRGVSLEDPDRPTVIHALSLLQGMRFEDFGVSAGLQDEHSSNSGFFGHPSFRELSASLSSSSSSKSPQMLTEDQHLGALLTVDRITDIAEIKEAVKYCRLLLATSLPRSHVLVRLANTALGVLLLRAFSYTDNVEYLNEAISVLREGLNIPGIKPFAVVQGLLSSLSIRLNLRQHREDLDEIMQLFPMAANHRYARIPGRFKVSCDWARFARTLSHPSTSAAYDCAVSLMQDSLTFAPTVNIQHFRLVAMRESYETLPLESASYQVHAGQLQRAIETLERGRALIWSEMRGLRSSIDQLCVSDPQLADKFAAVNRDLEMLALTLSPDEHGGASGGDEGMDPFGRLVVRQQKLLDDRDKLISQIRARKGLETFLKAPSFDNLRPAAMRGPVIVINHCKWRSDIIILLYDSTPSLISTADDFYDRANELRDRLLGARKKGLDSKEYEDTLGSVLDHLYELVGRPVIQRLKELHVPEQSRVWWCPTSAFCSLPLHAMGPIPSATGPPRYFLDVYIPSYTPTLSALIESNKPASQTSGKPSMLLVLQPDASMEKALDEMKIVQSINTQVTTLISARATPTAVLERLRDHRFVHIVCHGELEPGKPFDSSFKLYRGKRLSLLDIIRSRLPDGELAFLAACHTAELTDGSLADEALHLTAAMQYCGFRSVVGTMWAMADTDGQYLAGNFYKSVFSVPAGRKGVSYYERTAEALRDAVVKLRRRKGIGMTLERWVNFVHYGA
jgi:CHAT domain-containing protein